MADNIEELFVGIEKQKRQEINALMSEWKTQIASSKGKTNTWGENENPEDYFVSDGFFPGYYNQKPKVVFIEREVTFIPDGCDFVGHRIQDSQNGKINNKNFNSHLSYLVQGIKTKGTVKYENLEWANDYSKELADTNDYGFAYMNISKYANEVTVEADWGLINQFLLDSNLENTKFFHRELELLDPDIVITGNLWNVGIEQKYLDLCFGKIDWRNKNFIRDVNKVNEGTISIKGESVKLLDAYHLSARKPGKENFYDPVMGIIFGKE